MQVTINVPDNLPVEKVKQLIQEIEKHLMKEAITLKNPRPIGLAKGEFQVPHAFFEPLPDDLIKAFTGYQA
jgi:hypothetical protein